MTTPTILIPAYNPDEKLPAAIEVLRAAGYHRFVVVNDGSKPQCQEIFSQLAEQKDILLLHHSINCGKGRAMKTGFNEILLRGWADEGVIVCDADGQHPAQAVHDVAQAMGEHPHCLVLGVRMFFEAKNVPLPNLVGNTITRGVFRMLTGVRYRDTQCGLRGYPASVLRQLMTVEGERFEFENTMLLAVRTRQLPLCQVPMEAIYLEDNASSHFNRLRDSVRIYKTLLGFAKLPLLSALISFILFFYLHNAFSVWWGASLAYTLSLWVGYLMLLPALPKQNRGKGLFFSAVALAAAVLMCVLGLAGLPPMGIWWILALPMACASYCLWLSLRYGRKAENIRMDMKGQQHGT